MGDSPRPAEARRVAERFRARAAWLTAEESAFDDRKATADELYGLLSRFAGVDDEQPAEASTEASDRSTGDTISTLDAAQGGRWREFSRHVLLLPARGDLATRASRIGPPQVFPARTRRYPVAPPGHALGDDRRGFLGHGFLANRGSAARGNVVARRRWRR
jgi:hypothetical protein